MQSWKGNIPEFLALLFLDIYIYSGRDHRDELIEEKYNTNISVNLFCLLNGKFNYYHVLHR